MSTPLLKVKQFQSDNIVTTAPKALNSMGAKSINMTYKFPEGQAPITVQTPWMRSFGINKWVDEKNAQAAPKLSVTLSFMGHEQNEGMSNFKDFLEQIDEWAIDTAHKNSWEWLKTKSAPRDTLAFNYTRSLKVPVDQASGEPNGKPANMKLKLAETDSGFATSFFNMNKEPIEASDVDAVFTKGTKVRALIQCIGFWIAAGKFGLSWKLKQMILDPPTRIGKAYAFDDDEEESAPAPVQATKATPVPVVEEAIEDEEQEQEAENVVPEPVQAKKVVRKVVAAAPKK
jgi:hypothetical protein